MKKTLITLLSTLALWSSAETFSTDDQFSITLPDDWMKIPGSTLDKFTENLAKLYPDMPAQGYDYGFQLNTADGWFAYPYILIQVKNHGRVPSGELSRHKKFREDLNENIELIEGGFAEVLSNCEMGETAYDDQNTMLWMPLSMEVQDEGKIKALVGMKLTEYGIIQLNGYATEEQFDAYLEVFRKAFTQLQIDDEAKYKPQLLDNAPVIDGINMGPVIVGGLKGAGIGLGVGLIVYLLRRRKNQNRSSEEDG